MATQVLTMVNNQHYLYRMTVLVAMTSLASVVSHETLYQTILPAVISCAQDKVRPVLMQPAQALAVLFPCTCLVLPSAEHDCRVDAGKLLLCHMQYSRVQKPCSETALHGMTCVHS